MLYPTGGAKPLSRDKGLKVEVSALKWNPEARYIEKLKAKTMLQILKNEKFFTFWSCGNLIIPNK